ncbi:MAG: hypothetical protein V1723_04675 [Candidatus Uhrbacteria bacterium]
MSDALNMTPEQERPRALERTLETLERRTSVAETTETRADRVPAISLQAAAPTISETVQPVVEKSALRRDVENALADGLGSMYAALPPDRQATFRLRGETLAARLENMLASGRLKLREVHDGIESWLKLIPGANRWFLLQEVKVKTDAVNALQRAVGSQ